MFCSFPFIFSPYWGFQDLSDIQQLLYYSIFIVIFQFGWAATQISHLSLVPDLTPYQHERTGLLTLRYVFKIVIGPPLELLRMNKDCTVCAVKLRYSFTVLSNIAVYVLLWIVLYLTCDKETTFGPSDKYRFQVRN